MRRSQHEHNTDLRHSMSERGEGGEGRGRGGEREGRGRGEGGEREGRGRGEGGTGGEIGGEGQRKEEGTGGRGRSSTYSDLS